MRKTMSFAIVHFCVAFSVGYMLSGSILIGSSIALIEPAVNTIAYYFHEQAWNRFAKDRQVHDQSIPQQMVMQ